MGCSHVVAITPRYSLYGKVANSNYLKTSPNFSGKTVMARQKSIESCIINGI